MSNKPTDLMAALLESFAHLRSERDRVMWSPGDPCGSCGSTDTYVNDDREAACKGCGRSDGDESGGGATPSTKLH